MGELNAKTWPGEGGCGVKPVGVALNVCLHADAATAVVVKCDFGCSTRTLQ